MVKTRFRVEIINHSITESGIRPVQAMGNSKSCPAETKVVLSMVKTTLNTDNGGSKAKQECALL